MKNIVVSGARKAVVIVGPKKPEEPQNKLFCWFGLNRDKKFEVGTIIALDAEEAKRKLVSNRSGGHYSLKEVDPKEDFELLGVYNHIKIW